MRDGGSTGTQIIEPIAQVIAAPNAGAFLHRNIPNEDSLDFEFTDANLFSLNRFPGIDRFEGGLRANVGLHAAWTVGSTNIDTLVGQSYREHLDKSLPLISGLDHHVSDVVARATITPASWFDLTARTRVDPRNGDIRFGDVVASAGTPLFRPTLGYLYSSTNPYFLFDQSPASRAADRLPGQLLRAAGRGHARRQHPVRPYKLSGYVRRDLTLSKIVSIGTHAHV